MNEILILVAFGALQLTFHKVEKLAHGQGLLYRVTHSHKLVWLLHPAVAHTVQDYAIHVVIYSGKLIGH